MARIFAAIPLDGGVAEAFGTLMTGLDGARWTPPERLHLTLRFAGELADDEVARLRAALAEVRSPPVRIELAGVGSFDLGRGRGAVWAGVRDEAQLLQLQAQCEAAARQAGLTPDERVWLPHVTVGYTSRPSPGSVDGWIARSHGFQAGPFEAPGFGLYESVRTGGELAYRLVQSYQLAA